VTSADYPLLHHIFLLARDVQQRPYTSSLPYRAKDDLFLVGAAPDRDRRAQVLIADRPELGVLAFEDLLLLSRCQRASPASGSRRPVGTSHESATASGPN
jgi:hypothetical protein